MKIKAKIILIGVGVTIVLMLTSFLISYNVYMKKAKEDLLATVYDTLEEVENTNDTPEEQADLRSLSKYIKEEYENEPESEFANVTEKYEYYREKYNLLYETKKGMIGMSQPKLQYQATYDKEARMLTNALIAASAKTAFVGVFDTERNRIVYCIDSVYQLDGEYTESTRFPGDYYQLVEGDGLKKEDGEKYKTYFLGGKEYKTADLYGATEENPADKQYIVTVFLEYDESDLNESMNRFIKTELIALSIATVVMSVLYWVLAHYALLKNVVKLNEGTEDFKENLLMGKELVVVDPDIRTKDEIGELSKSFLMLEKEIINYTNKIEQVAKERERLNAELSIASKIQGEALPEPHFKGERIELYSSITPAKEVGGDFYDYFRLKDGRLAVIISDVTGKGIPAALFMMKAKALIKTKLLSETDLGDSMYEINNELLENNKAGLFVTTFVAVIDEKTGKAEVVSAGHEKPFICENGKAERMNINPNFVLGGLKDFKFVTQEIDLKGKKMFLYTDGLNESVARNNEEFGYERIKKALDETADGNLEETISYVKDTLQKFVGDAEPFDDVTIVMLGELKNEEREPEIELFFKNPGFDIIDTVTMTVKKTYDDISAKTMSEIAIIYDEVINNFVAYEKKNEEYYIEFKAKKIGGQIVTTFRTNGEEFDPLKRREMRKPEDIGGWGLSIVNSLSNGIEYKRENNNNILTIKKDIFVTLEKK